MSSTEVRRFGLSVVALQNPPQQRGGPRISAAAYLLDELKPLNQPGNSKLLLSAQRSECGAGDTLVLKHPDDRSAGMSDADVKLARTHLSRFCGVKMRIFQTSRRAMCLGEVVKRLEKVVAKEQMQAPASRSAPTKRPAPPPPPPPRVAPPVLDGSGRSSALLPTPPGSPPKKRRAPPPPPSHAPPSAGSSGWRPVPAPRPSLSSQRGMGAPPSRLPPPPPPHGQPWRPPVPQRDGGGYGQSGWGPPPSRLPPPPPPHGQWRPSVPPRDRGGYGQPGWGPPPSRLPPPPPPHGQPWRSSVPQRDGGGYGQPGWGAPPSRPAPPLPPHGQPPGQWGGAPVPLPRTMTAAGGAVRRTGLPPPLPPPRPSATVTAPPSNYIAPPAIGQAYGAATQQAVSQRLDGHKQGLAARARIPFDPAIDRYRDMLPYAGARNLACDKQGRRISGNAIQMGDGDKPIIACQYPKPGAGLGNHLSNILDNKPPVIVVLASDDDMRSGGSPLPAYFRASGQHETQADARGQKRTLQTTCTERGENAIVGDVKGDGSAAPSLTLRWYDMKIKDEQGREHQCTVIHCPNWIDREPVDAKCLETLAATVNHQIKQHTQGHAASAQALIHCKAGVGRTGTLMAAMELQKPESTRSVEAIVNSMREQRAPQMVQTKAQEALVCEVARRRQKPWV